MLDDPVPIRVAGACAAAVRTFSGAWKGCSGTPAHAAVWLEQHTRRRWLIFLCERHHEVVDGAHPITPAERVELERRQDAERRALNGEPWVRPQPLQRRPG